MSREENIDDEIFMQETDEGENEINDKKTCDCNEACSCGEDCQCDENHRCSENCECHNDDVKHFHCHDEEEACQCEDGKCHCHEDGSECSCHEGDDCDCGCENKACSCDKNEETSQDGHSVTIEDEAKSMKLANQYLNLAKQVQADFDNYRRHAIEDIKQAKINGQVSVIEAFLPCLDTFKEAKKSINDEVVLKGIEMIEDKINSALKELGVTKIDSIGQVYNPHYHNVIAVMNDQEKDNDIILDEYQAGYMFNDKVIRYSKVIVNKKED